MHDTVVGRSIPRIRLVLVFSVALTLTGLETWQCPVSYSQDDIQLRSTPATLPKGSEGNTAKKSWLKSPFKRPKSQSSTPDDKASDKTEPSNATTPAVQTGDSNPNAKPDANVDVGFHPSPSGLDAKILEDRLKNAESRRQAPTRVPAQSARLNTTKLDDIIRQGKSSLEGEYLRADALLVRYQFSEAMDVLREIRKVHGAQPDRLNLFGEYCLKKGLPDLAEETFKLASQKQTAATAQTKADWAQNEARAAKRKSDDLAIQAENVGSKNLAEGLRQGEEALRWNQLNANAHRVLGLLYERRKDWGRAADHDFAFMKLSPGEANRLRIVKRIDYLKQQLRQSRMEQSE